VKLNESLLAKAAGIDRIGSDVCAALEAYADRLIDANRKINLISRSSDIVSEITNQLALSLLPLQLIKVPVRRWVDIGSGGGFPVVPLSVLCENTRFTAVESVAKKAYFIERTCQELGITNLEVIASTIEQVISQGAHDRWDVVSIKAVTDLEQSLSWASALLVDSGKLITYKPISVLTEPEPMHQKYGFERAGSLDVKELIDTIDLKIVMYKKS
jgi:16S rRNA (guanine527-N7)-methyltransferase